MANQTWEDAVKWLIAQPEKQEVVIACYYDQPLRKAAERYHQSPEWQNIRKILPQSLGLALDIGAGNGIASYALAKEGWTVTALEPDPSALVGSQAIKQLAEETLLPIKVYQEWGENLPFPDNTFDLVFCRAMLHHAKDLRQLCLEIHRVLKPGGKFIAVREHIISSHRDLPIFLNSHPLHNLYGGENAYLLKEYLTAIKDSQLQVDQVLGSFDSVINYAPHTSESLKEELKKQLNRLPLGKTLGNSLNNNWFFTHVLRLLSKVDHRPGRLFSFVCYKLGDIN